nr:MAG TPA: hypothetical protein [Caudoviricetes sp.]
MTIQPKGKLWTKTQKPNRAITQLPQCAKCSMFRVAGYGNKSTRGNFRSRLNSADLRAIRWMPWSNTFRRSSKPESQAIKSPVGKTGRKLQKLNTDLTHLKEPI